MLEYVFIVCVYFVIMTGNTLADNNKLMTSSSVGESCVFVVNDIQDLGQLWFMQQLTTL